jgi:hypothetical protein
MESTIKDVLRRTLSSVDIGSRQELEVIWRHLCAMIFEIVASPTKLPRQLGEIIHT